MSDPIIIDDGSGHYSIPWARQLSDALKDKEQDEAIEDKSPLSYIFEVDIDGTTSDKDSSELYLTRTLEIELVNEDNEVLEDDVEIIVTDSEGAKHYVYSKDGKITIDEILMGPIEIEIPEYDHKVDEK